jgi:hypothetical protein
MLVLLDVVLNDLFRSHFHLIDLIQIDSKSIPKRKKTKSFIGYQK